MINTTTFDLVRKQNSAVFTLLKIAGGSLLIALAAQIKIPLFFTPVPVTLQTLTVMLLGGLLGKKEGLFAVLLYIGEISAGLPFASSGLSNPLTLIGPTGGYLAAMALQAWFSGWLVEKNLSFLKLAASLWLVSQAQMIVGASWLAAFVGAKSALSAGYYPFFIGEAAKCFLASQVLTKRER
jgi:biotin transport system substrate-specific component